MNDKLKFVGRFLRYTARNLDQQKSATRRHKMHKRKNFKMQSCRC